MNNNFVTIGIDVSKKNLDVFGLEHESKTLTFPNNINGIIALKEKLLNVSRIVLEPSGGYEALVASTLYEAGHPVCVVNGSPKSVTLRVLKAFSPKQTLLTLRFCLILGVSCNQNSRKYTLTH
jgi:hypothetical protein